ncbi:pyridoxamine 5'-phosphate oxidase family protein [Flavilitoribacter nigricans]|uniref:Flavin-nucleotide-binding protein n=1 Tax=Flavilitoribacter nigricans (strain ATCC 23147 / DSM 23189 / NBRC 102662 / NCIMB 1420 / SS-2) TaxID=1122177 RepID=A0A2D0NFN1_FLAN2|nr:pyridoxamine 5'-phosphate oxidase family protein [Flavilitoribacter nigricans]PHN07312.1 flavin-nucleotide-binding protein [Flavilitoribacter nigricans DSM 23189 = NBRC 102662]
MEAFEKTSRNQVKRIPKRGHYDRPAIYAILDDACVGHVGFALDGQPFVIPTIYGRDGDTLYLHGATTSRMLVALQKGLPVCVTVTHIDGLVLARSAFHHSMNYRSAVIFGTARLVEGAEKNKALEVISEQILPGRWEEVRGPNAKELKATSVVALEIEQASAKIRTGPPGDDKEDYELPIWAGVLPINQSYGAPQEDPLSRKELDLPASVLQVSER